MIRLVIAPEPPSFDQEVRKPGQKALAAIRGEPPSGPRKRGRPLSPTRRGEPKTVDDYPYWQRCLDDLHDAYSGICAYYGFWIDKAALPQVDHFVSKKAADAHLAYEWSNYRLACGYANACKNKHPDVLDPASIEDGWFQLDLLTLQVTASPSLPPSLQKQIEDTIERLKLCGDRAKETRKRAMDHFRSGRVQLAYLHAEHPFLAKELARQGIRRREDLPPLPPPDVLTRPEPEIGASAANLTGRGAAERLS